MFKKLFKWFCKQIAIEIIKENHDEIKNELKQLFIDSYFPKIEKELIKYSHEEMDTIINSLIRIITPTIDKQIIDPIIYDRIKFHQNLFNGILKDDKEYINEQIDSILTEEYCEELLRQNYKNYIRKIISQIINNEIEEEKV